MLNNIKTSTANKAVITELTHKLQLGPENVIARMAFAYSIANSAKLDIKNIKDAGGKEYNVKVLFGTAHIPIYVAMICQKYGILRDNKDVAKYIKLHVDDGLENLYVEYAKNANGNSFDFFHNKIELGLKCI